MIQRTGLLIALLWGAGVHAQRLDCAGPGVHCEGTAFLSAIVIGSAAIAAVPGLITGIGNATFIGKQPSSTGWLVSGLISATLQFAVGGFALAQLVNPPLNDPATTSFVVVAVEALSLGVFDVAMAVVAHWASGPHLVTWLPHVNVGLERGVVTTTVTSPLLRF